MNFSKEESKENDLIIKAASGNIKTRTLGIKKLPFPCACAYVFVRLRRVKTKQSISTRKFAASGQLKHSFQIPRV